MIELKNVSFSYNSDSFMDIAELCFDNKCLTAIVGENGSGKSTLLKLIAGAERRFTGNIFIDGSDILKTPARKIAKALSYFPQGREVCDMTAFETVLMGRYPHNKSSFFESKRDYRVASDALRLVGMSEYASHRLTALSYGERQRIYLAMNIAQEADNCLFDEPTNFIDARAKFLTLDILKGLRDEGKCIICVLHDIALAMKYADRIVVMKNGSIFADGAPDMLYEGKMLESAFGIGLERHTSGDYLITKK